jgi:CHAT domain-containing protein/Tfp pilus assembly protein PilF
VTAAAAVLLLVLGCRREGGPPPPAAAAAEPAAAASVLEASAGASVRRRLQDHETHVYAIELAAGQYLRLSIEQRGVDLVAALAAPHGGETIETDELTGAWGTEEIFWQAASSGSHRLVLTGSAGTGEYTATIAELRDLTPESAKRVEAGRKLAAARERRRAGDLRQAIALYEQALALWSELGDGVRQGRVDCWLGVVWEGLHEVERALAAYERALTLLEHGGDVAHRAFVVYVLGRLYCDVGQLEKARDYSRRALGLRREMGDLSGEAKAASNLGNVYEQLAESQEALAFLDRALDLSRQIGNRYEEALALHNRGKSYLTLGQAEQALDDFTDALTLREELGDRRAQASTLSAIGEALMSGGEASLLRAVGVYERALELAAELEDPRRQTALAENNLGTVYIRLRRYDEAREVLLRARAGFRELGLRQSEAVALSNLGWLFSQRRETAAAMGHSRQALALFEEVADLPGQVGVLHVIAELEHASGDLVAARASIERAVTAIEGLRARPASHDLRSSYFATMQSRFELYVRVLMDLHRRDPAAGHAAAALGASERARARSLLDNLIESGAELRRGVPPELLAEEQRLEGAINAKEHQRLRLLDGGGGPAAQEALDRELRVLLREYDQVRAEIRLASPRYAALTQPRPLTAQGIRERIVDRDTLLLQYDLGAERSYLWAVTPQSIASFELPPREKVEAAARRAYRLLAVSNRRESRAPTEIALDQLSEMLLAPAADMLDRRRLLVVSEGALQYIPFGALPRPAAAGRDGAPGPPLAFDHEISHMPSSSSLAVLRELARGRPPAPGLIAVVADPVFQSHDPRLVRRDDAEPGELHAATRGPGADQGENLQFERLVYSRREAEGILGLAAGASFSALGFDASKPTVTSGVLSRYRYVHFATHGDLNAEHPELSRLVLSLVDRDGRQRSDGFLHAHEIYNLELPADLVVLSACRTALGKEVRGEGLVGLTQGFMYAGASRLIVSLWQVDDRAAAELMVRFYELLLSGGRPPAAALSEAQLSIAAEKPWQSPYYWAGFVLQGEW